MSVCPSVIVISCLELSIFIPLAQVPLSSLSGLSQVTLKSFSAFLAYFVGQTEPKIRLYSEDKRSLFQTEYFHNYLFSSQLSV